MNHVSCLVSIQSKIKLLTGSEKKVADYVLENYMEVLDYTVTELAEKEKKRNVVNEDLEKHNIFE